MNHKQNQLLARVSLGVSALHIPHVSLGTHSQQKENQNNINFVKVAEYQCQSHSSSFLL